MMVVTLSLPPSWSRFAPFVILSREAANESPPIVSGRLPCPYSADRVPLTQSPDMNVQAT